MSLTLSDWLSYTKYSVCACMLILLSPEVFISPGSFQTPAFRTLLFWFMPFFVTHPTYCIFILIFYILLIFALIGLLPAQPFLFWCFSLLSFFMWVITAVHPLAESPSCLEKYSILGSLVMGLCLCSLHILNLCTENSGWVTEDSQPFLAS